ncbi:MAG: hypothetical protein AB1679_16440 [Actinomycetota bacterium]
MATSPPSRSALCLFCIGVVLILDPDWPLRLPGLLWWSAIVASVAIYLVVRYRRLRRASGAP